MSARRSRPGPFDELLTAARAGSSQAMGELLEACRPYLLLLANQQVAADLQPKIAPSDLVQQTLLEAQQGFPRFQGATPEELQGWLRQALENNMRTAAKALRHTAKRELARERRLDDAGVQTQLDQLKADEDTPSKTASAREQALRLREAIAQLAADDRQVIVWRGYEQLSFDEIGRRLDRSPDAARKLFARALQRLKRILEPNHGAQ